MTKIRKIVSDSVQLIGHDGPYGWNSGEKTGVRGHQIHR